MEPAFVQIEADMPPSPGDTHNGRVVRSWRWSAIIYSDGVVEYLVSAETLGRTTIVAQGDTMASLDDVPVWIPRPPDGWLASLEVLDVKAPGPGPLEVPTSSRP